MQSVSNLPVLKDACLQAGLTIENDRGVDAQTSSGAKDEEEAHPRRASSHDYFARVIPPVASS